jgi:hypothetical protein
MDDGWDVWIVRGAEIYLERLRCAAWTTVHILKATIKHSMGALEVYHEVNPPFLVLTPLSAFFSTWMENTRGTFDTHTEKSTNKTTNI